MDVESLLPEELNREFEQLKVMEVGNETYSKTVEGLTRLADRAIEIDKMKVEHNEKLEAQRMDNYFRTQQMEDENKDRLIKNILSAVSIIGGFAITVWGTKTSIKFEETGTITTIMGRGFINKLLPKK